MPHDRDASGGGETTLPDVLTVGELSVRFTTKARTVYAVEKVSFSVGRGELLALVGESGSGKSVTTRAILGLVPPPGVVRAKTMALDGVDLLHASPRQLRELRGSRVALIPQNPMTALNPVLTIGQQLREGMRGGAKQAKTQLIYDALEQVGIPEPTKQLSRYPHQYSGGMLQRILIAAAILNGPKLLLADEPTTALDVTIQAQVLELLTSLARSRQMAVLLISHNLGVVAGTCDRIGVMYAGELVEVGPIHEVFEAPRHPYTRALLDSTLDASGARFGPTRLRGLPPSAVTELVSSCRFAPRCAYRRPVCDSHPNLDEHTRGRWARCWRAVPPEPWWEDEPADERDRRLSVGKPTGSE